MSMTRPLWMRRLRLYRPGPGLALDGWPAGEPGSWRPERVHACSLFKSVSDPDRFAIYSVRDVDPLPPGPRGARLDAPARDHTLTVVREFRRVPLEASALGLVLFTARWGSVPRLLAALAHFAERAVGLYQPAYLLLARSQEDPRMSALLLGVHECAALQVPRAAAFSLEGLLAEAEPLLAGEPEAFAYCPGPELLASVAGVSPYAV
jgi:hypothetical protein